MDMASTGGGQHAAAIAHVAQVHPSAVTTGSAAGQRQAILTCRTAACPITAVGKPKDGVGDRLQVAPRAAAPSTGRGMERQAHCHSLPSPMPLLLPAAKTGNQLTCIA